MGDQKPYFSLDVERIKASSPYVQSIPFYPLSTEWLLQPPRRQRLSTRQVPSTNVTTAQAGVTPFPCKVSLVSPLGSRMKSSCELTWPVKHS